MHNIFLVCTSDFYYKNKIFDLNNPANRDNYYYPYYLLKKEFENYDICLNTYDYFDTPTTSLTKNKVLPKAGSYFDENTDKNYSLIFFDTSRNSYKLLNYHKNIEKFLVIFETEVIIPKNWNVESHKHFKKIFTWNDRFVDGEKYIKFYWPNKVPEDLVFDVNKKNKLCTMIVGHKFASHPLELYTERVKAIRWFERNHSEDFDLYGIGWDRYCFKSPLSRLNRFNFLRSLLKPRYPSYEGSVESKKEIYKKYKFAICYENARDIPGYITEKIFDCFFAGCVPIYWGAPNITEYIPADTFIDKRDLKTYEELYAYIKNMPDIKYLNYLTAIKNFIRSDKIFPFSAEYFVQNIVKEILEEN